MKRKFEFTNKDFLLVMILSATLLLCNQVIGWHTVYKEHNLNISILSDLVKEVTSSEFGNYIIENPNTFVYFGAVDDIETRTFEKEFKRTINRYYLNDKVIYVNTKDLDIKILLDNYDFNENNIDKTPVIVRFEEGKILNYINIGNNKMDNKSIIRFFRLYEDL